MSADYAFSKLREDTKSGQETVLMIKIWFLLDCQIIKGDVFNRLGYELKYYVWRNSLVSEVARKELQLAFCLCCGAFLQTFLSYIFYEKILQINIEKNKF